MKKFVFILIVLVSGLLFIVQSNGQEQKKSGDVFIQVDEMPVFPGGEDALRTYIAGNVKYPDVAKKEGIAGKVIVTFVIDESGKVTDVKVVRGVHKLLDEESVRVVSGMPAWQPGKEKGKAVKVQYTIPIQFALK